MNKIYTLTRKQAATCISEPMLRCLSIDTICPSCLKRVMDHHFLDIYTQYNTHYISIIYPYKSSEFLQTDACQYYVDPYVAYSDSAPSGSRYCILREQDNKI